VRAAYEFIRERNPVAARRIAEDLLAAGDSLAELPNRGRPGSASGTRELVIVRPYIIVYEVRDDAVIILRIWHGAQRR
jgi:toxin ParE1/3/4